MLRGAAVQTYGSNASRAASIGKMDGFVDRFGPADRPVSVAAACQIGPCRERAAPGRRGRRTHRDGQHPGCRPVTDKPFIVVELKFRVDLGGDLCVAPYLTAHEGAVVILAGGVTVSDWT